MEHSWRRDLLKGILLLLAGLFMMLMTMLIYIGDSRGKEMTSLSGIIVLLVCLFWIVGGTLAGRRLLEPDMSLAEKLFAILFALLLVGLQIGAFLVPADSPSQIQLYLARNLMLSGVGLWFGGLYLNRALTARGKHSASSPPGEQT